MRKYLISILVLIAFGLGLSLGSELQSLPTLRTLSTAPAPISKLDWVLLKAKVDRMGATALLDKETPNWQPEYSYDAATDGIAADVQIDPEWLVSKGTGAAGNLARNGEAICIKPFVMPELISLGVRQPLSRCYVRFYAQDLKGPDVNLIATFENGKLALNNNFAKYVR
jgi:hypothetical protein